MMKNCMSRSILACTILVWLLGSLRAAGASAPREFFESESAQAAKRRQQLDSFEKEARLEPANRVLRRKIAVLYSQSPDDIDKTKAKTIFEQLLKEHEDSDSLMDFASCFYRKDFAETYKLCQKAARLNNGKEYTLSMLKLGVAGSLYRKHELSASEKEYKDCLASLTPRDPFVAPRLALAGLAGVYWQQKRYEESAKSYEDLYRLERDVYGAGDVECGWALLQESYAVAKLHNDDRGRPLYTRAVWVFRKCNFENVLSEYENKHGEKASPEIISKINVAIFGAAGADAPEDPIPVGASPYTEHVKKSGAEFFRHGKRISSRQRRQDGCGSIPMFL